LSYTSRLQAGRAHARMQMSIAIAVRDARRDGAPPRLPIPMDRIMPRPRARMDSIIPRPNARINPITPHIHVCTRQRNTPPVEYSIIFTIFGICIRRKIGEHGKSARKNGANGAYRGVNGARDCADQRIRRHRRDRAPPCLKPQVRAPPCLKSLNQIV